MKRAVIGCTKSHPSENCCLASTSKWLFSRAIRFWKTRITFNAISPHRRMVFQESSNDVFHFRDFSATLIRLSRAIRGVGNPLVAAYARCYLMRVGREKFIQDSSFVVENVRDLLLSYHQVITCGCRISVVLFIYFFDRLITCSCTAAIHGPS